MKNISKEKVLALRMPPHCLSDQRRIAALLDLLQVKVDSLNGHQEETSKELDALMPSILSKASSCEL